MYGRSPFERPEIPAPAIHSLLFFSLCMAGSLPEPSRNTDKTVLSHTWFGFLLLMYGRSHSEAPEIPASAIHSSLSFSFCMAGGLSGGHKSRPQPYIACLFSIYVWPELCWSLPGRLVILASAIHSLLFFSLCMAVGLSGGHKSRPQPYINGFRSLDVWPEP